jgi:hypothetical protein
MAAPAGNWRPSLSAMVSSWSATAVASGWANMVRTAAATISADPRGTWATTLRMKWILWRRLHKIHYGERRIMWTSGLFVDVGAVQKARALELVNIIRRL